MVARCRRYSVVLLLVGSFLSPPAASAQTSWSKIYETIIPYRDAASGEMTYTAGFGKSGGAASTFIASGASWGSIKIRMEMTLKSNNTKYFSEVSFDKWDGATIAGLQLPDDVNNLVIQRNISNLVIESDLSSVKTGAFALGRLEIWPFNYVQSRSGLTPVGDAGTYDWDDTAASGAGGHGSFQLHNLTDTQSVMAWNMHRPTIDAQDLGLGPPQSGQPDWTFAQNSVWDARGFKVQIFVGTVNTETTISAPSITGEALKGRPLNLSATTSVAGRVSFFNGARRIARCINRPTTNVSGNQVATCTFKPSTSGAFQISARFIPTVNSYSNSASSITSVLVGRRTGVR